MSKSGFIRNVLFISGLAWFFIHFIIPEFVHARSIRTVGAWGIVVMTAWGVLTLLANRVGRPDK